MLLSILLGLFLGILSLFPPIGYEMNLFIRPDLWLYLVLISAFISFNLILTCKDLLLKAFVIFVWVSCFYSESPFISFNAYLFFVFGLLIFSTMKYCKADILIKFIETAFWVQLIIIFMQQTNSDVLMNFGTRYDFINNGAVLHITSDKEHQMFLGTVRQQMRVSSLFAVMAPFLVYKNKWYIIPISILAFISMSAGFALSVIAGCFSYFFITSKHKKLISAISIFCAVIYFFIDFGSFESAWIDGRFRIWIVIIKTWLFNTKLELNSLGDFNIQAFLTGHGLDTFRYLFPIYKHDPNPFAEAHNCWLQLAWECGIIGVGLFVSYFINLLKRLYVAKEYILLSGLVCIGVNAMSAFPTRMIQTMFIVLTYFAICENKAASNISASDSYASCNT